MRDWTFEELQTEHEKIVQGLQYTIGERERLKALFGVVGKIVNPGNAVDISCILDILTKAPSERFQDIFAFLLSGCKYSGFFVEFGACDGVAASNTFTLEKKFAWRGILAEPGDFWHDGLLRNRTARIDKRCVPSVTGNQLQLYRSDRPENSSVDATHPYLGNVVESHAVETVSFMDLLRDHSAPRAIDFLSVDTEGHEKEVFANFDFDRYRFGFICVEQHGQLSPEDRVKPTLEAAGYRVIFPREIGRPIPMQITGIDEFFLPEDSWLFAVEGIESTLRILG